MNHQGEKDQKLMRAYIAHEINGIVDALKQGVPGLLDCANPCLCGDMRRLIGNTGKVS